MFIEDFIVFGFGKGGKGFFQLDISKVISYLWKNEVLEIRVVYENKVNVRKFEVGYKIMEELLFFCILNFIFL